MRMTNAAAIATALICAGATAHAAASLTNKEKAMLQQDARGGAYEQQLSEMALKKSSNPKVKQFAQTNIADHATLIKEAQAIASQNDVTLNATPSDQDREKLASLAKQSGRAFDDAFAKAMGVVNEEDKQSFASDEKAAENPQVKQYLQHSAAIDSKHASMVQGLNVAD